MLLYTQCIWHAPSVRSREEWQGGLEWSDLEGGPSRRALVAGGRRARLAETCEMEVGTAAEQAVPQRDELLQCL